MRRVFIAALVSLLLWSQAAECRAQSSPRAPKRDADALAAALRIAGGLESGSDKDYALFELSQSYAKVGRFDEAERAVSSMDDGGMKAASLVRLAGALAEAGKLDRVLGLLEESLRTIRRVGKDEFNSSSAFVLGTLVGGEERWDSDALTLKRVTVKGVLARLVEAGRADEAAKVLSLVKSVALDFEMDDEAQVKLFADASRLYARSGDAAAVEEALAYASAAAGRVDVEGDKALALCELADAYFGAGERERAESALAEATQTASPLEDRRDFLLRRIMRGYVEAGLYEQAREVARILSEEEGARAFATLAALGPESKPADFDAALSYAVSAAASLESDSKTAWALVELASAYGARSPAVLAKVAEAASSLGEPGSRALVLVAVGDGHGKAGRKDAALEHWRQALASASALELSRIDIHPGDSRMNDGDKLNLLFALASRFADAGSHGLALEIVRDVEEVRERALRLAEGHPVYASETAPRLAKLANALLRAGRRGDALEVLEAASRTARGGEESSMHVDSLGAVAAAYARAGESARAKLHFRRALEAAQATEFDDDSRALCGVLTNVGTYYAEVGMKPDAAYLKAMRRLVRKAQEENE